MIPLRNTVLLALAIPLCALADDNSARTWLNRMSEAVHTRSYEGVFVYRQDDGSLQTMQIFHDAKTGSERERLVTLNGASREVIRDNDRVTCILPDSKKVLADNTRSRSFTLDFPDDFDHIETLYSASVGGTERIAGLTARRISLSPRDSNRYGHAVWVDEDSGLMLKSELLNERGERVEQLMFTSLKLYPGGLPASLLKAQGDDAAAKTRAVPAGSGDQTPAKSHWRITALPPGFHEDVHRLGRLPATKAPVEHFVYSDGLASVSVFIEQGDSDLGGFVGSMRRGAINAYTRLVDGHRITVLGEVPETTVRLIGDSVRPVEQ